MVVEYVIVLGVPKEGTNLDTSGMGVKPQTSTSDNTTVTVNVGLALFSSGQTQRIIIAQTAASAPDAPETLYFNNVDAAKEWLERTSYGMVWAQSMTAIGLQTIRVDITKPAAA